MHNTLKEKLAQGKRPLGTFVGTGSAAVVECLGCAGLDFVILDNEHSPVEAETTADMVRAAELRGVTPLARVREISRPAILKLLEVASRVTCRVLSSPTSTALRTCAASSASPNTPR